MRILGCDYSTTCPDCGVTRQVSAAQFSRICNGLRSGRCYPCSVEARTRPAIDRFMDRVIIDRKTGCWVWIGPKTERDYGVFAIKNGRYHTMQAHRWIWTYHNGPVPPGLEIDHLCFNTWCVSPDHLEAVTPDENVRRWKEHVRQRTHCINGHEFTEASLYIHPRNGTRECRICRNEREMARRRRALA